MTFFERLQDWLALYAQGIAGRDGEGTPRPHAISPVRGRSGTVNG
jgi:hypothetical protein